MPSMPSMSESSPSLELSVVIPVWNGEHNLGKLLPRLNSVLASVVGPASEVVVALPKDDPVGELVEWEGGRIANFDFPGFGHALNAGLSAARGRWVVTMDADFSHHPEFIRTLWLRRNEADLLIASRYVPGAYAEMSLSRRVASRVLNRLYRSALALPHRDLSSGFRMYRSAVLEDVGPVKAEGLDALQEILVKAFSQGWMIQEVPLFYRQSRMWAKGRMTQLGMGYLRTLGGLIALRNSVKAADYDSRAFDSWWSTAPAGSLTSDAAPAGSCRACPRRSAWTCRSASSGGCGRRAEAWWRGRCPSCRSPTARSTP